MKPNLFLNIFSSMIFLQTGVHQFSTHVTVPGKASGTFSKTEPETEQRASTYIFTQYF